MPSKAEILEMLAKAENKQITSIEFMRYCIDNYDDVYKILTKPQRIAFRMMKPAMKAAIK